MSPITQLLKHPLHMIGDERSYTLSPGEIGAIMGRRGEGKTALLVQIALHAMVSGKNVLHVSLNDPVGKVVLWYQEIFSHWVRCEPGEDLKLLFGSLLPHRFILTFRVEGMNGPRLEERINDLIVQKVFVPELMIIDGMDFSDDMAAEIQEMKALARKLGLGVWLSVPIHRYGEDGKVEMPPSLSAIKEQFSVMIYLSSEGGKIKVKPLLPAFPEAPPDVTLDPSSLLVSS